jgi:hypothetical protein
MPRSRGRKPKPKPTQSRQPSRSHSGWRFRYKEILGRPWAGLVAAMSVVATLFTLWGAYWNTIPDVRARNPVSSPFSLPFAVSNNSHLFDMRDLTFYCGIKKVAYPNGGYLENFSLVPGPQNVTIATGDTFNFRCPIGGQIETAKILLWAKYRTFLFPRMWLGTEFTWVPDEQRWIKGKTSK